MAAIPFENLDVLLGRGVRVDLDSVIAKLVTARRGGYCFEHGTLFQAALRALGVEATAHAARVLLVAPKAEAPRTHMFLTIVRRWTRPGCSIPGFGGQGPLVPVPLVEGREVRQRPRRASPGAAGRRVGARRAGERRDDGAVDLVARAAVPGGLRRWPTTTSSTFPESPFVTRLMIRALTPDGRVSAMNRDVTVLRDGVAEKRQLADRAELRALLARTSASTCRRSSACACPPCPSGSDVLDARHSLPAQARGRFTEHPYRYEEHGGTRVSSRELGVDEHAVSRRW